MWTAQSITGNLLLPLLWASTMPPAFWAYAGTVPKRTWLIVYCFGLAWGIGGAAYGFSLTRIGVALTYSLSFGLTTVTASVVPIMLGWNQPPANAKLFGIGLVLTLVSIVATGVVGSRTVSSEAAVNLPLPFKIRRYHIALLVVFAGGILSSAYGLAFSLEFQLISGLGRIGISPVSAPLILALPIYAGAASFAITFGLVLASRISQDVRGLLQRQAFHNWGLALLMGLAGVGGSCLFGAGTSMPGHPEPNIAFTIFIGFFVLGGNLVGVRAGELRDAGPGVKGLYAASIIGIVAGSALVRIA